MKRFAGTYRLISFEDQLSDGQVYYPYGQNPVGLLIYDSTGNMAVQIMKPDRPRLSTTDWAEISASEVKESIEGFTAFFGSYDVDEKEETITHQVKGHLLPNSVGKDLKRKYEFSGKRLILRPTPKRVIVWERIN